MPNLTRDLDQLAGAALDQRLRHALALTRRRLTRAGVPAPTAADTVERFLVRVLDGALHGADLLAGQAAPEVRQ